MIRSRSVEKQHAREEVVNDQDVMSDGGVADDEGAGTADRSFKYAVVIYAVVEFIAIALLIYYKLAR